MVKDWLVSGCQPIVLVRCLRCFAMLLTNNDKDNYMLQKKGQWVMRNPGGKQNLFCAHYTAMTIYVRNTFTNSKAAGFGGRNRSPRNIYF